MTPSQIADAQKLAKEWMEEHGKEWLIIVGSGQEILVKNINVAFKI